MKKFKIIGFLAVVLFFGILTRQEVWAEFCNNDSDCPSDKPGCFNNSCVECVQEYHCWDACDPQSLGSICFQNHKCRCIECSKSEGERFNANSHSCISLCKTDEEWSQFLNQCQPKVGQTKCPDGYVSSGALGGCVKASSTPSSGGGTSSGSTGSSGTSSGSTGGGGASTVAKVTGDQRCWTKDECITYRKNNFKPITDKEAEDGFYSAAEHSDAEKACGRMRGTDVMGFCAPGAIATTAIGFGSVKNFANFGVFINYIYKYSFVIVSILGVLMIIVAGIQWLTSAGNQEKIGAAKKRIMGAVIGILILALSYTILNTINPYLVNLRLPQVWILNTSSHGSEFCRDLPNLSKTMFREISSDSKKVFQPEEVKRMYDAQVFPLAYSESSFLCGQQYIYSTAANNGMICRGHALTKDGQICLRLPGEGYQPTEGIMGGLIKGNPNFTDWDSDALDEDEIELYVICDSGDYIEVRSAESMIHTDGSTGKQGAYSIVASKNDLNNTINKCKDKGSSAAGFLIRPELDKNTGAKGIEWWDQWWDQAHWLGRESGKEPNSDAVDFGDGTKFFDGMKKNSDEIKKYLIPLEYFNGQKTGQFRLNIDITNINLYSNNTGNTNNGSLYAAPHAGSAR